MTSQHGAPPEYVQLMIAAQGGNWWTHATDTVAGGAAVARTEIEAYRVPDAARTLLGWRPIDYPNASAVDESVVAVFDISGSNYKYQPQEVICGNTANSWLSVGLNENAISQWYPVYAPVSGGETISVGIEPTDAVAGNRRSAAEFTWCNVRLQIPVIYSECSREVATGTTATVTAGTTLNINNAHRLIEVGGVCTNAAVAADEQEMITAKFSCTVLSPVQNIWAVFEPTGAPGLTSGSPIAYVARRSQNLSFLSDRATVKVDFDQDTDLTAAGQYTHYIRWI